MTHSIVVAKYKENVDWLGKYIDNYPIYLYDKSGETQNYNNSINVEYIKNVGRESHTYLHHIIKNYDNLSDYVIFTQAKHNDHIKKFDKLFKKGNGYFHLYYYPKNFKLKNFHGTLTPVEGNLTFGQWFEKYIEKDFDPLHFRMKFGAIFCVSKDNILSRPKSFYIELHNQLEKGGSNPELGHFFERSWYYIFNCHKTPSKNFINNFMNVFF